MLQSISIISKRWVLPCTLVHHEIQLQPKSCSKENYNKCKISITPYLVVNVPKSLWAHRSLMVTDVQDFPRRSNLNVMSWDFSP